LRLDLIERLIIVKVTISNDLHHFTTTERLSESWQHRLRHVVSVLINGPLMNLTQSRLLVEIGELFIQEVVEQEFALICIVVKILKQ